MYFLTSLFIRMLASMLMELILTEMLCSSLHLAEVSFLWAASDFLRWLFRTCKINCISVKYICRYTTCNVSRMFVTSATSSVCGQSVSSSGLTFFDLQALSLMGKCPHYVSWPPDLLCPHVEPGLSELEGRRLAGDGLPQPLHLPGLGAHLPHRLLQSLLETQSLENLWKQGLLSGALTFFSKIRNPFCNLHTLKQAHEIWTSWDLDRHLETIK